MKAVSSKASASRISVRNDSPEMKVRGETGTLKRTASMVPEAVASSKFDEAKAALERGAFDEALRLLDVAHAEDPDDAQTRELYAVTHLAKAIRLSEKARQARQAAIERRAIEYDQERSEEHTSELQSQSNLVCRLLLEKKQNR